MKEVTLYIDTSDNKMTIVGLTFDGKTYYKKSHMEKASQNLLSLIVNILREYKFNFEDISDIDIKTGPGSYTGLRVGVAVANALSMLLNIPINRNEIGSIVKPNYE